MTRDRIPVAQLMTSDVQTVTATASIEDAAQTLLDEDIGSLVVVDDDHYPVGMFTTTDIAEFAAQSENRDDATVNQYMTERMITVGEQDSLRDAAATLISKGIHHLPVTDEEGVVVGMLSTLDLTAYYSYTDGQDAE